MDKKPKKQDSRSAPSLLLRESPSMMSWPNESGSSMLMPVAAHIPVFQGSEENQSNDDATSRNSSVKCRETYSALVDSVEFPTLNVGAVSQLQQPIICRRSSSPSLVSQLTMLTPSCDLPPSAIITRCGTPPVIMGQSMTSEMSLPPLYVEGTVASSSNSMPIFMAESETFQTSGPTSSPENNEVILNCKYVPVQSHWFFKEMIEGKETWHGFCPTESAAIEEVFQKGVMGSCIDTENVVMTNGRRYDVYVKQRERRSAYWTEDPNQVRRCTWFYKCDGVQRYLPYDEVSAEIIEDLYYKCVTTDRWLQRAILKNGEIVVAEDHNTVFHYANDHDDLNNVIDTKSNTKIAFRGLPEDMFMLPEEINRIDHLVLIVQGIGSVCDLRFRNVSQCVDGFRNISNRLTECHFKDAIECGRAGRVEFLPVAWHAALHTNNAGFDKRMKAITLPSIPKLRYFTNDTLLDILLYSSPMYCETIINTVTGSLNSLYSRFLSRNPQFTGGVSVAGHSLGSLILFDILANPKLLKSPPPEKNEVLQSCNSLNHIPDVQNFTTNTNDSKDSEANEKQPAETMEAALKILGLEEYTSMFCVSQFDPNMLISEMQFLDDAQLERIGLPEESRRKLLSYLANIQSQHHSSAVADTTDFENLSETNVICEPSSLTNFCSSLCPVDPTETILSFTTFPRLKFHPDCFFAFGSPIAMFLTVRGFSTISQDFHFATCCSFFNIFHPFDPVAFRVEPLINPNFTAPPVVIPHHKGRKRMHIEIRENLTKMGAELKQKVVDTMKYTWEQISVLSTKALAAPSETVATKGPVQQRGNHEFCDKSQAAEPRIGSLNGGRRIDYVLQEKPLEAIINEYLFALTSHATYWDSDDTVLFILKELHALHGVVISLDHDVKEHIPETLVPSRNQSLAVPLMSESCGVPSSNITRDQPQHEISVRNCSQFSVESENTRLSFVDSSGSFTPTSSYTNAFEPPPSVIAEQLPSMVASQPPLFMIPSQPSPSVGISEHLSSMVISEMSPPAALSQCPPSLVKFQLPSFAELSHCPSSEVTSQSLPLAQMYQHTPSVVTSQLPSSAWMSEYKHSIVASQPPYGCAPQLPFAVAASPPSTVTSALPSPVMTTQLIGPPPLSGFIKKSPFNKQ